MSTSFDSLSGCGASIIFLYINSKVYLQKYLTFLCLQSSDYDRKANGLFWCSVLSVNILCANSCKCLIQVLIFYFRKAVITFIVNCLFMESLNIWLYEVIIRGRAFQVKGGHKNIWPGSRIHWLALRHTYHVFFFVQSAGQCSNKFSIKFKFY